MDANNNKYLTKEGLKKIKEELEHRKNITRKEIARAIKDAKEQGDLSENAEYAEAKSQETQNEKRIAELESIVKNCVVIKKSRSKRIDVGSMVKVRSQSVERIFYIVGSDEADPAANRISNESPIGAALMGKNPGEEVSVDAPGGVIKYKIVDVE